MANEEYATQTARDWNTRDETSGLVGYVLRAAIHQEYWIPAGELEEFNERIEGLIECLARFDAPPAR